MDRTKLWIWIGVAAAVVVVAGALWYFTIGMQSTVPDVVGAPAADAVRTLEKAGYTLGTTTQTTETTAPAGVVTAESPAPGTSAKKGTAVNITVAAPPVVNLVAVPSVTSLEASAAASAITAAGLVPVPYTDYNANTPEGQVFGQVPTAGQQVVAGTTIALGISKGPVPTAPKVPNVVGKTRDDATSTLTKAGFTAKVYEQYSSSVAAGIVISQFPAANAQALAGSQVAIEVSKGKAPSTPTNVSVPNVVGKTQSDATTALKNAGLGVETYNEFSSSVAKGSVIGQLPKAGEKVAPGTVVAIAISEGKPPTTITVPNLIGKSLDDATKQITDLGLKPVVVPDPKSDKPLNTVIAQSPEVGSTVPPSSQVVIQIAGAGPDVKPTPY